MVAAGRDAERRAKASGVHRQKSGMWAERALAVRLDHLHSIAVRIGAAERVRLFSLTKACRPRRFNSESRAERRVAKQPNLRRGGSQSVARLPHGLCRL